MACSWHVDGRRWQEASTAPLEWTTTITSTISPAFSLYIDKHTYTHNNNLVYKYIQLTRASPANMHTPTSRHWADLARSSPWHTPHYPIQSSALVTLAELDWAGLGWAGLSGDEPEKAGTMPLWAGLGWAGLGWAELGCSF